MSLRQLFSILSLEDGYDVIKITRGLPVYIKSRVFIICGYTVLAVSMCASNMI